MAELKVVCIRNDWMQEDPNIRISQDSDIRVQGPRSEYLKSGFRFEDPNIQSPSWIPLAICTLNIIFCFILHSVS